MPAAEHFADLTLTADAISLVATGEVDIATADQFLAAAQRALDGDAGGTAFVLDLSAVSFMDCAGLTALLAINASSLERGRTFAISKAPRCVLRILSLTGLDREFALC